MSIQTVDTGMHGLADDEHLNRPVERLWYQRCYCMYTTFYEQ